MSDLPYLVIIAVLYLLPTIVAACRGHLSLLAIFLLNAIFGWTWIGWVAALIWACTGATKRNQQELLVRALKVSREIVS